MLPTDKYIEVHGHRVRYWKLGDGEQVVLMVHGIAASCEYWMYNIKELAARFTVYAVDLVGFGKSDKPQMEFSAENFARFLKDFLGVLNIDRINLVGHSLGGAICLQFTIDYPELLEKLVLVDSAGFGQELPFSFRLLTIPWLGRLILKFDQRQLLAQALRAYAYNRKAITDEFITEMHKILQIPGNKQTMLKILRQHASLKGIRRSVIKTILENLPHIKTPTLIIWGRQDRLLPPKHAQIAIYHLSNAKLHIFDHCGHIPMMEVREKFNRLLLDYL